MQGPIVLFGPPVLLTAGPVRVWLVGVHAIGADVGVVVRSMGGSRPSPDRRTDSRVLAVASLDAEGNETACTGREGVLGADDERVLDVSTWRARTEPQSLRITLDVGGERHVVELEPVPT